ncbi:MAG TPA: DUF2254 domain-containing protein, partial [Gemmatimonadaceae bacterium]|nr:DUF2254 domain-containing protein [Gemmatimonadaceae bacterium]
MADLHFSRLALAWRRVRDSLWFAPSIAVVLGTALAVVAVQIPTPAVESEVARLWLFGGSAEGARGVLGAIASSLITVTGVVFSVTIVALQLASSQFTPRVVGSFVADRVNQMVLGIFIGTFTYSLLVLRTIRSETEQRAAVVPYVAVTIALLLLLVSVAALIVFINHAARSVQASVILHRETHQALQRVRALFPDRVERPAPGEADVTGAGATVGEPGAVVAATASGYLQAVQADTLWRLEDDDGEPITIQMAQHIGAFLFPGRPLAYVWPARGMTGRVEDAVREAFVLGPERTPEQDVELGLVKIADIAVRALSPGINDPTTAL